MLAQWQNFLEEDRFHAHASEAYGNNIIVALLETQASDIQDRFHDTTDLEKTNYSGTSLITFQKLMHCFTFL